MKKLLIIFSAAVLLFSCSDSDNGGAVVNDPCHGLAFAASVADPVDGVGTRASGTEFFDEGYQIDVTITTNYSAAQKFDYYYTSGGIFEGRAPFYFSLDDSYITNLRAIWPSEEVRKQGIVTDQRLL